jgi:hypothetical protein
MGNCYKAIGVIKTRPELRLRCCAELDGASHVAQRQFVTRKPRISVVHRVMTSAHTLPLKCEYGMSVEEMVDWVCSILFRHRGIAFGEVGRSDHLGVGAKCFAHGQCCE